MFAVIYQFNVKQHRNNEFVKAWKQLTKLIYEYEGSLGSRLHKLKDDTYIAYAQWPEKATWEKSGNNLPNSAEEVRKAMRDSCSSIEVLYELNSTEDLLKSQTSGEGDR